MTYAAGLLTKAHVFQIENVDIRHLSTWFLLVLRIVRIGDIYNLPTSGILTTSVNTPSQTSQTVGNFYDVIGRIGSIYILKVLSQTVPDVGDFYDECVHKIACLGRSLTIGDFYDECEHEICLSGISGMLDFAFSCYQSLIFSKS